MKTLSPDNSRRVSAPHGILLSLILVSLSLHSTRAGAQVAPPADSAKTPLLPPPAASAHSPSAAADKADEAAPPPAPLLTFSADRYLRQDANGDLALEGNVVVEYSGATISADRLEGNANRELIFSGNARLVSRGVVSEADSIHVYPRSRSYRLVNPRGILAPEILQGKVEGSVIVNGGEMTGYRTGYTLARRFDATTCIEAHPHYDLRVREAELFPYQKVVLRHVGVVFFGRQIIVLPVIVIPLDQRERRRPRTDYLPEFGHNTQEGYYARFPYTFAVGAAAATFVRADVTEKEGMGYRFEQEYLAGRQNSRFSTRGAGSGVGAGGGSLGANGDQTFVSAYGYGVGNPRLPRLGTGLGPQDGGLFAMQGYLKDGLARNFNASFRHQQEIGGDNQFSFVTELQRNSFYTFSNQTNLTSRLLFGHSDAAHGSDIQASLSFARLSSATYSTNQITADLRQTLAFATLGANRNSLAYHVDVSRFLSDSNGNENRTARIDSDFQFQHMARDYSFTANANTSDPLGTQTSGTNFGTLERLPELQFTAETINFKGGLLQQIPARLDFGVGRYSEPSSNVQTERALLGLTLEDMPLLHVKTTEITTGGGFEQRLYGDSAAQYIVRNTTRLRQRLGGRSGFDLNYQYEQPEGGTPFVFDTFLPTHYITAEGGYLNDPRFQMTARVGYDFLGSSQQHPWQSLSTRLMWRPTPSVRLDSLSTYDPNTGRFFALTNTLRLRGRSDFAIDLVSRYDPTQGKFSQVNSQFDLPLGRTWRVSGLLRYNGFSGLFESTNFRVAHEWDCLEASLTYTENPYGGIKDRQIFFTLRIKAIPLFRSFDRGPAGESIGTGIGDIY